MSYAVELKNISKSFPGVIANDDVSMTIEAGEIRALVGENGAGKTTLMNILYGLYQPDKGEIIINGQQKKFKSPIDAIDNGLGMVHQHFMLFPNLTVVENIIYGMEPQKAGFIKKNHAREKIRNLSKKYNLAVNPDAKIKNLSVGVCQRIEILKALYRQAEIIIFDEPTAVLTPQEQIEFFEVLKNLASQGKTIIFISHKLNEVMEISDKITVMRLGKVTANLNTEDTNQAEICNYMVGRDVLFDLDRPRIEPGSIVFSVKNLNVFNKDNIQVVKDVSFEIREGEIVGIAGVAGNGQDELVQVIAGLSKANYIFGRLTLNGVDITKTDNCTRRLNGLAYIPQDRYNLGLALQATVAENLVLGFLDEPQIGEGLIIKKSGLREFSQSLVDQFRVKVNDVFEMTANLSGGNLQKVVVAREMHHKSKFLIAEQPTRGVDIGSTEFIHKLILKQRDLGNAVLLISTELSEVMSLSDRILVIYEGQIMGELSRENAKKKIIGLMMAGIKPNNDAVFI
jgi:simple sugar transport system ATP-binding protein